MASMHSTEYNSTLTQTGTFIGDYLLNNTTLDDTWTFELLQEMYFYIATWYLDNIDYKHKVNYTRIDEVLIEYGIHLNHISNILENKLIDYVGFKLTNDDGIVIKPKLIAIISSSPINSDKGASGTVWHLPFNTTWTEKSRLIQLAKHVHEEATIQACGGAAVLLLVIVIINCQINGAKCRYEKI
jgi:hypothetical protein